MQHHSIVTYLRRFGFAVGLILFLFMVLHFEQGARDPVYVKGKPSLQWFAVSSSVASNSTDSAAEFTEAEQVADVSPRSQTTVTSHSEASPPTAHASNEPARPAHNPPQISNAHVIPGKAVGKENH